MKAIILAAGKGERLRGLVDTMPKPMVRIGGKPILQHNIEWLRNHGITDLYINLHHLPEKIADYFGNGEKLGVTITYSYEEKLLGTAGAVRRIADCLWKDGPVSTYNSPFLVIYGDNLLTYDLGKIVDFHKARDGIATIAFYRKDDVSQSGIAVLDPTGRVLRFIEKPKPEEEASNLVNTGIYILDKRLFAYIPKGITLDFGRDLFPEMLKNGEALYGIEVHGTLTAIDTPDLFRAAVSASI